MNVRRVGSWTSVFIGMIALVVIISGSLLGQETSTSKLNFVDAPGSPINEGGSETYNPSLPNYFNAGSTLGQAFTLQPAVGDLDRDGNLDLVIPVLHNIVDDKGNVVTQQGSLVLAFGNGAGKFTRFENVFVGDPILQVALGDLNEDGFLDIAFYSSIKEKDGTHKPALFILFGDKAGKFTSREVLEAADLGMAVLIADVNGDGHLDLVLPRAMSTQKTNFVIETRLGDGTGRFSAGIISVAKTSVAAVPGAITSADIDKDGHVDIVAAGRGLDDTPSIICAYGDGEGSFVFTVTKREIDYLPMGIVAGDFNGDGYPDVAVALPWDVATALKAYKEEGKLMFVPHSDRVSLLLNDGDRGWRIQEAHMGVQPMSICGADLNGDGLVDIVAFDTRGNASVLMGNTRAELTQVAAYTCDVPMYATTVTGFLGDFNNDGNIDLGVEHSMGGLVIRFGDGAGGFGSGWFSPPIDTPIAFGDAVASTVTDFDGDGHLDVVYYADHAGVGVAFGDGTGHFEKTDTLIKLPDYDISDVVMGDFNGDGISDVLVGVDDGKAWLLRGTGQRLFRANRKPVITTSESGGISDMVAGDLNEDGCSDVIVAPYVGSPFVALGTRENEFQRGEELHVPMEGNLWLTDLSLGDFNADRHLDLLATATVANRYVGTVLWLGDGSGGFKATTFLPCYLLGIGDYNKDGFLDFMGRDPNGGGARRLFLGDGSGQFKEQDTKLVGSPVADFNGDGYLDSVIAGEDKWYIDLVDEHQNPVKSDTFAVQGHPSGSADSFAVGDFNEDGWPDLATDNGHYISVLLNRLGGTK